MKTLAVLIVLLIQALAFIFWLTTWLIFRINLKHFYEIINK